MLCTKFQMLREALEIRDAHDATTAALQADLDASRQHEKANELRAHAAEVRLEQVSAQIEQLSSDTDVRAPCPNPPSGELETATEIHAVFFWGVSWWQRRSLRWGLG